MESWGETYFSGGGFGGCFGGGGNPGNRGTPVSPGQSVGTPGKCVTVSLCHCIAIYWILVVSLCQYVGQAIPWARLGALLLQNPAFSPAFNPGMCMVLIPYTSPQTTL